MSERPQNGKTVTQDDVAHRAGVTRSIVSYVINNGPRKVSEETRARVLAAIKELGYRPNKHAQMLSTSDAALSGKYIGIILASNYMFKRPYYGAVLAAIHEFAHERECHIRFIRVFDDFNNPALFNELIHPNEISGVILLGLDQVIRAPEDNELVQGIVERVERVVCVEWAWPDVPTISFDRQQAAYTVANRLLSMGGHTYEYDGFGNRIAQTVSTIVTKYLLDVQPGLVQVIGATVDDTDTERYIHGPRGIHAVQDASDDWRYMLQDGLGSVRSEIEANVDVSASGEYEPYGVPTDVEGAYSQPFRFTGEMRDGNALQYHRARYYAAESSSWASLDLIETFNKYAYVSGNPVSRTDPSGLQWSRLCRQATQSIPLGAWGLPEIDDSLCVAADVIENFDDLLAGARNFFNRVSSLFTNANPLFASLASQTYFTLENGIIRFPNRALEAIEGIYLDDAFQQQAACGRYAPGTAGSCGGGAIAIPMPGVISTPAAPTRTNILSNNFDDAVCRADVSAITAAATANDESSSQHHYHYGTPDKIAYILATQSMPISDETINPNRARYGTGVYFTDIVPGSISKPPVEICPTVRAG